MSTAWVVAQIKSWDGSGWADDWNLGGVFTTEAGACKACTSPDDGYWPVEMDQFLGTGTVPAPGMVFPVPAETDGSQTR